MKTLYSILMNSLNIADGLPFCILLHGLSRNPLSHKSPPTHPCLLLLLLAFILSFNGTALRFQIKDQNPSSHKLASMSVPMLSRATFPYQRRLEVRPMKICDISDYGAIGDGQVLNTASIQAAMDACGEVGGGVVYVPPGHFLTGTVILKSNSQLYIDKGAIIYGSPSQEHYPPPRSQWYVILIQNVDNVEIIGGGIVDGQGLKFVKEFNAQKNVMVSWNTTNECLGDECRPRLIGVVDSRHVHIENIYLQQPAYWCLHIIHSDHVSIQNVSIQGDFNTPNTDGIDIHSSNNTIISWCHIDTGDDAICPKTDDGPLFNLTVTHCWLKTKSCAIKIGSETRSAMSRLRFEHITIVDSHRGLGLQLRDSGNIHDVVFANIDISTRYYDQSWWGRAEPIYVTSCPRHASTIVGSIYNVSFVNITAISENGIFLAGSKGGTLSGLKFSNVSVELIRSTNYLEGLHDYRPGCWGLVPSRMAGVFIEHAFDVVFQNVNIFWVMNALDDWELPLDFTPRTVGKLNFVNFQSNVLKPIEDAPHLGNVTFIADSTHQS